MKISEPMAAFSHLWQALAPADSLGSRKTSTRRECATCGQLKKLYKTSCRLVNIWSSSSTRTTGFTFVEINGMKISEPMAAFSHLWQALAPADSLGSRTVSVKISD
jgi:Cdc6-like AAA superfamily ATPase